MKFAYFAGFETAYQQAEQQRIQKSFSAAFQSYQPIISQYLSQSQQEQYLNDDDLVLLWRMVELSVLVGHYEIAEPLLAKLSALSSKPSQTDYVNLLRIEVTLRRGMLNEAYQQLKALPPRIGDIHAIEFTPAGLAQWEQRCWQGEHAMQRNALLTRLYLVMGWILANLGQYHDALSALERGVFHAGENDLMRILQLHIARVLSRKLIMTMTNLG